MILGGWALWEGGSSSFGCKLCDVMGLPFVLAFKLFTTFTFVYKFRSLFRGKSTLTLQARAPSTASIIESGIYTRLCDRGF